LKLIVSKQNVTTIVLGEPKRLNGTDSHITENVRMLFEHLKKSFPLISIIKYDERFTSKMASQSIAMMGLSKAKKQDKSLIDEVSATILLQSYMQSVGI
jgi:putative Holliday junction resolvase